MTWGVAMVAGGKEWKAGGGDDWATEVERLFAGLEQASPGFEFDGDAA